MLRISAQTHFLITDTGTRDSIYCTLENGITISGIYTTISAGTHSLTKSSLEILKSWIDLIDENGWVAREQILGEEARSKVASLYQLHRTYLSTPFRSRPSSKHKYPNSQTPQPSLWLSQPSYPGSNPHTSALPIKIPPWTLTSETRRCRSLS